ncbi:DUF1934 domain-containing protein [Thermobrachium celere]|uniref:DUF1934 domain-containing protein n=1 Tax=Thermobrachium celere DSM 8682 TaxID=941824 RepID=R7RMH2_9CLOT|nr:DUF1934 domain-containing protein [Thermobrachium celere]GFR35391.1 hypothetical protein TCEA9_12030 [Thermobrachium celere]CDF57244.1 hypothetical protein TCEL_00139 [Thermobrachium celere DSM 8682]
MENKRLISVKTKQLIDGQEETIELISEGIYYKDNDVYIAEYDESEISGMEGTRTTLVIGRDSLNIIRRGTTTSDLRFKKGESHTAFYTTPYGALEITISTNQVNIEADEKGAKVYLEYKMHATGLDPIINKLELNIK